MMKAVKLLSLNLLLLVFDLLIQTTHADIYHSIHNPKAKAFGNRVCTNKDCTLAAANFIHHGNDKLDPCDDFAQHACDRYKIFKNISVLDDTDVILNKKLPLLLKRSASPDDKPYHTLAKAVYQKCMGIEKDKPKKEKTSAIPTTFLALIDEIGGWPLLNPQNWKEFDSFEEYIADIHRKHDVPVLFSAKVVLNHFENNHDEYMLQLVPADALVLPYDYLAGLAQYLDPNNPSLIDDVTEIYSKIDNERQTILDGIKNEDTYFHIGQLQYVKLRYPEFDIEKYMVHLFDGIAEIRPNTTVRILNIAYFEKIHHLAADKRLLANYAAGAVLSKKAVFLNILQADREAYCLYLTRKLFEYPLSQMYVNEYFDYDGIVPKVSEMIKLMTEELHDLIEKASWLDDTTRSMAFKKLAHLKIDIGYPKNLFDDAFVSELYNIPPTEPSEDLAALVFRIQHKLRLTALSKISKPLDLISWTDTEQASVLVANAFNAFIVNRIFIPAGILSPPSFFKNVPDYVNYGAVGAVVAHEIMHGYDNEGRKRDETGDKRDWWNDEAEEAYKDKTECFIKQYTKEGVDGIFTLGENIADNVGMQIAYNAYKKLIASRGNVTEPALPGFEEFTAEQMFFLANANLWCNKDKTVDPNDKHPPGMTRLKVVAQNMEEFSEAFNCPKRAAMNLEERCSIW
uniref:Peptidase_M13 domain-containing protein n=1 Tax=Panagrellus redivivus TaxID=6233 RepID=A0A7E4VU09_PANRE